MCIYDKKLSSENLLVEKGYKLTKNRKCILEVFQRDEKRWLSAHELFDIISAENQKINFSTVYRNLEIFTHIEVLCRIDKGEGISYYILNNQVDPHHYFICKSCGKTFRINCCPLNEMKLKELEGFSIEDHRFEVFGYCRDCIGKGIANF
ncbi:MAG: Fur family transcriptional regulator [Eubacteriales bacterium]